MTAVASVGFSHVQSQHVQSKGCGFHAPVYPHCTFIDDKEINEMISRQTMWNIFLCVFGYAGGIAAIVVALHDKNDMLLYIAILVMIAFVLRIVIQKCRNALEIGKIYVFIKPNTDSKQESKNSTNEAYLYIMKRHSVLKCFYRDKMYILGPASGFENVEVDVYECCNGFCSSTDEGEPYEWGVDLNYRDSKGGYRTYKVGKVGKVFLPSAKRFEFKIKCIIKDFDATYDYVNEKKFDSQKINNTYANDNNGTNNLTIGVYNNVPSVSNGSGNAYQSHKQVPVNVKTVESQNVCDTISVLYAVDCGSEFAQCIVIVVCIYFSP